MKNSNLTKEQDQKQIALFKYGIIAPLLNNLHTETSQMQFFRNAASKKYTLPDGKETTFSSGTIKKWFLNYKKDGFNSLLPKNRKDMGTSRKLSIECVDKILELKQTFPHITGKAIYLKLIEEGIINQKDVSLSSVYRFLNSRALDMPLAIERKSFEMEFSNDCWQCDTSHGPLILLDGKKTQTYLIQIIDDASRLIVGQCFFFNDNALNFQLVLKEAIKIYGIPKKIFVDNGKPYKNLQFQIICASLGSILIHSRAFSPQSKR